MESSLQYEKQQSTTYNTVDGFLRLHYKYGHLSFKLLICMAKLSIIPKKFEKCDTPTCAACMYSKSTRKPWRGCPIKIPHKTRQVINSCQIVSLDQLVSPTQRLVAYMSGILTTKRYNYVTVFVYHFSIYSYMHLQQTASAEQTLVENIL